MFSKFFSLLVQIIMNVSPSLAAMAEAVVSIQREATNVSVVRDINT